MAKVLFQSTNPATFRSTAIGYLYEIAQEHEVVLLTEKLDSRTEQILGDKRLFPGLKKVVFFESPFHGNIFAKNYRLCAIMKKTIEGYKPDIVVSHTDTWPAEMYAMRFAKKIGATTVAIQSGFRIAEHKRMFTWALLMQIHERMPKVLPYGIKKFLVWLKKGIGYSIYHILFPILVGEMPFFGKTSFVFWHESPGLRDAQYSAVFSKRDYDMSVADGIVPEKLFVIGHPLEHAATKRFFEQTYGTKHQSTEREQVLSIMWSDENIGFNIKDHRVISEETIRKGKIAILNHIVTILADWQIFIKPHPAVGNASVVKKYIGNIPSNVTVVDPLEPADTYITMSKVIVGMPLPSTTLFTAQKQHPHKIILSVNINNEFLGDGYKDFPGIEYIDSEKTFIEMLNAIKNNMYKKEYNTAVQFDFPDAGKLIQHLYDKRIH